MRRIKLPPALNYKVRKIAAGKKITAEAALSFLVEKVCTPQNFLPKKVCTPIRKEA